MNTRMDRSKLNIDVYFLGDYACKSSTPLGQGCHLTWEGDADKDAFFYFGADAVCGNITMCNIHCHQETSTSSALFKFENTCKIDRLILDNIYQTTAAEVTAPLWENHGASIKMLIERDSITETIEK